MGMKHFAVISFFAAAAFVGCAKLGSEAVETVPSEEQTENTPFIIRVDTPVPEPSATKTTFEPVDYKVLWEDSDELALTVGTEVYKFTKISGDNNTFICYDFKVPKEDTEATILYPYSADGIVTITGENVNNPMSGTCVIGPSAKNPSATLKQLTALTKVRIVNNSTTEAKISSVQMRAVGSNLTGTFTAKDGSLSMKSAKDIAKTTLELSIPGGQSADVFVQTAPFTAKKSSLIALTATVNGIEKAFHKIKDMDVSFVSQQVNRTSISIEPEPLQTIFIDFGGNVTGDGKPKITDGWSNVTDVKATDTKLIDENGDDSGLSVSIGDGWSLFNPVTSERPSGGIEYNGIVYPKTAWFDGFVVSGVKDTGNVGPKTMTFSGLDVNAEYKFTLFGYRWNGTHNVRKTQFYMIGDKQTATLAILQGEKGNEIFEYSEHFAIFESVKPDSDGKITLYATAIDTGAANEAHLNAMVIQRTK